MEVEPKWYDIVGQFRAKVSEFNALYDELLLASYFGEYNLEREKWLDEADKLKELILDVQGAIAYSEELLNNASAGLSGISVSQAGQLGMAWLPAFAQWAPRIVGGIITYGSIAYIVEKITGLISGGAAIRARNELFNDMVEAGTDPDIAAVEVNAAIPSPFGINITAILIAGGALFVGYQLLK